MEYFEHGDLQHYLFPAPPLSEFEAQQITFQILEGLSFLHDNGFAHRDLKPGNILVRSKPPDRWWVKIGDFGISKRAEDGVAISSTLKGTLAFMAPELHGIGEAGKQLSSQDGKAADIWSLGEPVFQMLTKEPTFKNFGQLSSYVETPQSFPAARLHAHDVSISGVEFVESAMTPAPEKRPTAETALLHKWMEPYWSSRPRQLSIASTGSPLLPEESSPIEWDLYTQASARWTTSSSYDLQPSSSTNTTPVNVGEHENSKQNILNSVPTSRRARKGSIAVGVTSSSATTEDNLAELLRNQAKVEEAEQISHRARAGYEITTRHDYQSILTGTEKLNIERSNQKPSFVIGIDFGMTSTTVAFSFNPEWPPPKSMRHWPGAPAGLVDTVPTAIAYDILTDEIATWGFTANYEDRRYRIEELFKLYLDPEYRDSYRDAPSLKEALRWYVDYLACLYRHLNEHFSKIVPRWNMKSVEWVFSVPTTWKTSAKTAEMQRFIRSAGFGREQNHTAEITLTEAEAYCVYASRGVYQCGDVFLICDAGGGTTDINILKAPSASVDGIMSLSWLEGRPIGSTLIDFKIEKLITERLESIRHHLEAEPRIIAQKMMRGAYKTFKRSFSNESVNMPMIHLHIPGLAPHINYPSAQIENSKMIVYVEELQKIFDEHVERLYKLVDEQLLSLLKTNPKENVQYLVLSGELGGSPYVQNKMRSRYEISRDSFSNAREIEILTPAKSEVAVAHGLVMDRIRRYDITNVIPQLQSSINPEIGGSRTRTVTSKLRRLLFRGNSSS